MLTQEIAGVRNLENPGEFSEARVEAIGYIFHGTLADSNGKRPTARSQSNLLHFARCAKLEKAGDGESRIWFRASGWRRSTSTRWSGSATGSGARSATAEITQRILDEV